MATFEEQTECIVEALFSDLRGEDGSDCRSLETDSGGPVQPAGEPLAPFDPVVVARRLRRMGDQCNVDFERVSSEALAEVLKGKMEKFGAAVESLSRSWSAQNPELVYEITFLSVSVKLLIHVAKKVPAMVHPNQLINAINGNSQVRSYIEACGGWGLIPYLGILGAELAPLDENQNNEGWVIQKSTVLLTQLYRPGLENLDN